MHAATEESTPPDWRVAVTENEEASRQAFLARDLARLDELWSDDLLVNNPFNRIVPKRAVLDLLGRGVIAHHSFEVEPELIERKGDLAIVMGFDYVRDTPESPRLRRRFTNVWRLEGGAWRLFLRHASYAPA